MYLGWDIGIKHLAYCLMEYKDKKINKELSLFFPENAKTYDKNASQMIKKIKSLSSIRLNFLIAKMK